MKVRIPLNGKLRRAKRILDALRVPYEKDPDYRIAANPYTNGREEGFYVCVWYPGTPGLAIAWTECRGSDSIVVYVGEEDEINNDGCENDETWESARWFEPTHTRDAAGNRGDLPLRRAEAKAARYIQQKLDKAIAQRKRYIEREAKR